MKIEGSGIKSVIANSVSEEKGPSARQGAQKDDAPASSRVQLSALSARMQEIESRLESTPVVDTARVGEIKQAIAAQLLRSLFLALGFERAFPGGSKQRNR